MRLLRLELAAFGPFRDRFEIDFASFAADGVYLIAGPTGAGKSTILDAIVFALYGSAPRYEGGRAHLRSDLAGPEHPTWVELDFEVGARRLRVRRSPEYERPKQRGTGTTKEKASATLLERVDDRWEPLSVSAGEVGTEIGEILGLTKVEFLQVILLAQGGFAEFLRASSDERKQLLQRLFGTGSMRRLRELLLEDARAAGSAREELERRRDDRGARVLAALAALRDADGSDADGAGAEGPDADAADADGARIDARVLADAAAELEARVERADRAAAVALEASRASRAALDAATALHERWARRTAASARLTELERQRDAVDADRRTLADADRAAEAAGPLERWERADTAADRAAAALTDAAALLPDGVDAEREAVEREHELAQAAVARADIAAELEAQLPSLERAARRALQDAERADEAVDDAQRERAAAPAARDAIVAARESAATLAAGLADAETALQAARDRLGARDEADALEPQLAAAQATAARTAAAQADAGAAAARLQAARIAGMAGELAAALVTGEACPVCGSLDHPAPHAPGDDPVSADDVAAALADAESAAVAAREANDALAGLERRHAAAEARAGEGDREALAALLDEARARLDACTHAVAERERRTEELERHDREAAERDARIAQLESAAGAARAAAAGADARLSDARARLAEALEGHASARSLQAAATARVRALRGWIDAAAERERAAREQSLAAAQGGKALEEHGLPDRGAAAAMALPSTERTALRERIRAHDDALASARGVLAQPELTDLPEAPELAPLEAAHAHAEAAATAAARSATAAATTRDHAASDLAAATDAIRALADGAEAAATVRAFAAALNGENELRQDIETYVLATRLGAIIDAANLRLAAMTEGRFALQHDETTAYRKRASGLGIQVLDAHTGVPRTASSLSGGETFLASLALALGLADVVQAESGGVSLETLFVDEGFGSLDQDTLEAALATLDDLRAGGRSVGVISHVQQMQERIPSRIRVTPVPGGGSRIRVSASGATSPQGGAGSAE